MFKSKWMQIATKIIGITVGGFIGFNLSFLLAAFIIRLVSPNMGMGGNVWGRNLFIVVIYALFFGVKSLKIPTWIKATVFTMPTMSTLILIGIFGYQLSLPVVMALGTVYSLLVTFILWRLKWDWTYFYALAYVSVLAAYVIMAGIDI